MSVSEFFTLAFILLVFGGAAAAYVFLTLRVVVSWLRERGFFVEVEK